MSPYFALIRPPTLLLAVAIMLPGNAAAWQAGSFSSTLFVLMLFTALSLQALSNIANDYGDGCRGTDTHRVGPQRMVASGRLSPRAVRSAMWITATISLLLGILLLCLGFQQWTQVVNFMFLGGTAIIAAVGYSVGRYAYGYYGLGEIAVLIFFGLLAVMGSFYLQAHYLPSTLWLAAFGCGLFAAAVLMVNNLRDLVSDRNAGKYTMAVWLGMYRAKWLYLLTLYTALGCYLLYGVVTHNFYLALCLLFLPAIQCHWLSLYRATIPQHFAGILPVIVRINFGINVVFAFAVLLG